MQLGVDRKHFKALVSYADEYEARELLDVIMETYTPAESERAAGNPFTAVQKTLIDALMKAGVRQLSDIHNIYPIEPDIPATLLALLKNDPRVAQHATKQEL